MEINIDTIIDRINQNDKLDNNICNELIEILKTKNFFKIYEYILKLKNEIVKIQDYETASCIRGLEKTVCIDFFGEENAILIYNQKMSNLFIDLKDNESIEIYEKLFNDKVSDKLKKSYSGVIISMTDGNILIGIKEGKLVYNPGLKIGTLKDLIKNK